MAQVKITVRPNGPYRVEAEPGSVEMVDANGVAYDLSAKIKEGKTAFSLCRCGASANKPYCDGTHNKIGFQAAETAVRAEGGDELSPHLPRMRCDEGALPNRRGVGQVGLPRRTRDLSGNCPSPLRDSSA